MKRIAIIAGFVGAAGLVLAAPAGPRPTAATSRRRPYRPNRTSMDSPYDSF